MLIKLLLMAFLMSNTSAPSIVLTMGQNQQDEKLASILESIQKTSPKGLEIIEKIKVMKSEVNGQRSTKTLEEMVRYYSVDRGEYNITVIGWAASPRQSVVPTSCWRITLYFQDHKKEYQSAEWEYNKETNKLYPWEMERAPWFWSNEGRKEKARNRTGAV
jgi:hypothetical protein